MENYSRDTIAQIESGRHLPTLDFLTQFVSLTHTTFESLLNPGGQVNDTPQANEPRTSYSKPVDQGDILDIIEELERQPAIDEVLVSRLKTWVTRYSMELSKKDQRIIELLDDKRAIWEKLKELDVIPKD